eukprot:403338535
MDLYKTHDYDNFILRSTAISNITHTSNSPKRIVLQINNKQARTTNQSLKKINRIKQQQLEQDEDDQDYSQDYEDLENMEDQDYYQLPSSSLLQRLDSKLSTNIPEQKFENTLKENAQEQQQIYIYNKRNSQTAEVQTEFTNNLYSTNIPQSAIYIKDYVDLPNTSQINRQDQA